MTIAGVNISDTHCERVQREETNHSMIAIEIVSTEINNIASFTLALQSHLIALGQLRKQGL